MFLGGNLFSGRLTPPKFNMELENDAFQKESPLPGADFQVNHVNFQGCKVLFLFSPLLREMIQFDTYFSG